MIATREIQPPHVIKPRLLRVGIRIGKPLDFSRYAGMDDDRFVLRSIADEMMYELMQLSGQRYVDMYANRAKDLLAEGVDPTSAQLAGPPEGMPIPSGRDRAHAQSEA